MININLMLRMKYCELFVQNSSLIQMRINELYKPLYLLENEQFGKAWNETKGKEKEIN